MENGGVRLFICALQDLKRSMGDPLSTFQLEIGSYGWRWLKRYRNRILGELDEALLGEVSVSWGLSSSVTGF